MSGALPAGCILLSRDSEQCFEVEHFPPQGQCIIRHREQWDEFPGGVRYLQCSRLHGERARAADRRRGRCR